MQHQQPDEPEKTKSEDSSSPNESPTSEIVIPTLNENTDEETGGLIEKIGNPLVLERCLELLLAHRERMENHVPGEDHETSLLRNIYGVKRRPYATLFDRCSMWIDAMETPEEERERVGQPGATKA